MSASKNPKNVIPLVLASIPVLIFLLLFRGDIPDPDRNAHDMWANQLIEEGSLTISENGIFDDWHLYYPNTVPKPFELVIGFLRTPGGQLYHAFLTYLIAFLTLAAVWNANDRGKSGVEAALFLGLNPVFIVLSLRGNPAIPFLCGMYLLQSKEIKQSTLGVTLAALSRPEGFIYSGYLGLKKRRWRTLALLFLIGLVWLVFHKLACGSFLWASNEVKYSVAAMAYPTPKVITFFPWVVLRSILVLGAPASAILLMSMNKWDLKIPFATNFALLAISLAAGSLVLPRYIDQLFLVSVPFIFAQTELLYKGKRKTLIVFLMIASTQVAWFEVLPELKEHLLLREFYTTVQVSDSQVIATNELLIPGLCLANDITNPIRKFVSLDKAAWENATEDNLLEYGITDLVVFPYGMYFPQHTRFWLENIELNPIYY